MAKKQTKKTLKSKKKLLSKQLPLSIRAKLPKSLYIRGGEGTATLMAAAASQEGEPKKIRKFKMAAYNGGAMNFIWADVPVVVDLAGLKISAKARPVLKDHDPALVVGHSEKITVNAGKTLELEGVASGTGAAAQEVVANADNGFPWQASIGADIHAVEEIHEGEDVVVNHQKFTGPLLVVRASRLGEVSFVSLGADDSTEVRMTAAHSKTTNHEEHSMDFDAWLKAKGFDPATLSDAQKAVLDAAYKAELEAAEGDEEEEDESDEESEESEEEEKPKMKASATPGDLKAARALQAAESRRVAGIRKVCAGKHEELEAKAIEEGWSTEKTELHVLRAARSTPPAIHGSRQQPITSQVLEAAVLQATRASEVTLRPYGDRVLQAAHSAFRGRIGLQELLLEAAYANGYAGRSFRGDHREVLRAAFGFSTIDISGILSNIANKFLLEGFMAVDQAWREVSAISPVTDFKTITRYRLVGDETYEKLGPGGQIKHGELGEESFTNKAETYAKMFSITRQDQVNDDLSALSALPRKLGRGAGLKLNDVFWTEFLANSDFFTTGRANYISGATTTMTIDGLTQAEQAFMDQVDPDGKPLGLSPAKLLVPTALDAKARGLYNSTEVRDTTASTHYPTANVHAGKWKPVTTPYLSNANYPGYSALAWYLLANPADLAVIETVFLNGQESPTIESAEADFSVLGIQMRGFHDFGVSKQEYRAGVKSKGAA